MPSKRRNTAFIQGLSQGLAESYRCHECGYESPSRKNFKRSAYSRNHLVCSTGH